MQVKLCDPCLSALKWFIYHARRCTSARIYLYLNAAAAAAATNTADTTTTTTTLEIPWPKQGLDVKAIDDKVRTKMRSSNFNSKATAFKAKCDHETETEAVVMWIKVIDVDVCDFRIC